MDLTRQSVDKDELVQSLSDQLNENKQEYIAIQSAHSEDSLIIVCEFTKT